MSIYNDVHKPDDGQMENVFKHHPSPPSESSDAYTFMSAPKFGGAVTNSERGSMTQSFKSPNFRMDKTSVKKNDSGGDSLIDMALNANENHDF